MRVVLDTNVLLSAMLSSRGAPSQIIKAWEQSLFTVAASPELIAELRQVSERPFFRSRLSAGLVERLAASLRDLTFWCHQLPVVTGSADAKDDFLLALAEASQADFLVTGDKGLLRLGQHKSTRIVAPAELIEHLKTSEPE